MYCTLSTPVGDLKIEEQDGVICGISFLKGKAKSYVQPETPLLKKAVKQLEEYFAGKRKDFDLPLSFNGTKFQNQVWTGLKNIPFGETLSYAELARKVKNPKACRAVGGANNKNPICIVVPCHRVIGANGSLVGFGGGLKNKEWLLRHEGSFED